MLPTDYTSVWHQINHDLVRLKQQKLGKKETQDSDQERDTIWREYRNPLTAAREELAMVERRTESYILAKCDVYWDVWRQQGGTRSKDFLLTLSDKIITTSVFANAEIHHLELTWKRSIGPWEAIDDHMLRVFRVRMQQLEHRLKDRLKEEALEAGLASERAASLQRPAPVDLLADPNVAKPGALVVGAREAKRQRDAEIRRIWGRRKGDLNYEYICSQADRRGIAVVPSWREKTWLANLKNTQQIGMRAKVKKYLHDVIRPPRKIILATHTQRPEGMRIQ